MNRAPRPWLALAAGGMLAGSVLLGADWPQYRGADRTGVSTETGLLRSWPEGGPRRLWRVPLGPGYSGISAVGGKLYTMFGSGKDEFAVCLEAATGAERWRFRIDDKWSDSWGEGPRSTPTVHDGRVYVVSTEGMLHALGAEDGKPLFSVNLAKSFKAKPPQWGFATSPLVEGERLVVNAGGREGSSVVALDRVTGEVLWRSQGDPAGYSAPVAASLNGVRQVLVFTGSALISLDPQDGQLLWRHTWTTSYDVNAATPIVIGPDRVFVSSGYDKGAALLQIVRASEAWSVKELWTTRQMRNRFSSSVLVGGHFYGFDEKNLTCLDAATGDVKWEERGLGHGSLVAADGHLIVLGEEGQLLLLEATPEAFRAKARFKLFETKTWTVPTLSGGTLFVRDEKELVALAVVESEPQG